MNDSLRDAVSSSTDLHLNNLMEIGELAVSMTVSHRQRVRSLTKDTSTALEHTSKGLVELVKYLLANSHSYVLLGKFTTDPLEKSIWQVNPLSANFTKWSNALKQFVGCCRRIVWVCLTILWDWRFKG